MCVCVCVSHFFCALQRVSETSAQLKNFTSSYDDERSFATRTHTTSKTLRTKPRRTRPRAATGAPLRSAPRCAAPVRPSVRQSHLSFAIYSQFKASSPQTNPSQSEGVSREFLACRIEANHLRNTSSSRWCPFRNEHHEKRRDDNNNNVVASFLVSIFISRSELVSQCSMRVSMTLSIDHRLWLRTTLMCDVVSVMSHIKSESESESKLGLRNGANPTWQ